MPYIIIQAVCGYVCILKKRNWLEEGRALVAEVKSSHLDSLHDKTTAYVKQTNTWCSGAIPVWSALLLLYMLEVQQKVLQFSTDNEQLWDNICWDYSENSTDWACLSCWLWGALRAAGEMIPCLSKVIVMKFSQRIMSICAQFVCLCVPLLHLCWLQIDYFHTVHFFCNFDNLAYFFDNWIVTYFDFKLLFVSPAFNSWICIQHSMQSFSLLLSCLSVCLFACLFFFRKKLPWLHLDIYKTTFTNLQLPERPCQVQWFVLKQLRFNLVMK